MQVIEKDWQDFYHEFDFPQQDGFYVFPNEVSGDNSTDLFGQTPIDLPLKDKLHYSLMKNAHDRLFTFESSFASKFITVPSGRTILHDNTWSMVLPYTMERVPEALLPIMPPTVARLAVAGSGAR